MSQSSDPRRAAASRAAVYWGASLAVLLLVTATLRLQGGGPGPRQFTDIASPGMAEPRAISRGACWADIDGDHDQDLFVANLEGHSRLWRNDGRGMFVDIAERSGIQSDLVRAIGCAFVDMDADGDPDLFVTVNSGGTPPEANRLYRNTGEGTFVDTQADVAIPEVGAASVDWADFDRDGDYDGFVAARIGRWILRLNAFFRQDSPFVFVNVAARYGLDDPAGPRFPYLGSWFDYDADGDVDLLLAIDYWGIELYRNEGNHFAQATQLAFPAATDDTPGAPPNNAMGVTWGDYDNDGCFDVFITGLNLNGQGGFGADVLGDLASRLYRSNCDGTFADVTATAGLHPTGVVEWGTNFIDFDNDGDLDLSVVAGNAGARTKPESKPAKRLVTALVSIPRRFMSPALAAWLYRFEAMVPASGGVGVAAAMPNFLYQNLLVETCRAKFVDVTARMGAADMGSTQGSAWADVDNDGDLDWFVPNRGTRNRLFRNDGPVGNYLRVHVIGRRLQDAVGAWVKIKVGTKQQIRAVHVLDGYLSQSQMDPHFGLGSSHNVDELWIRWPGTNHWILVCRNVAANRVVTIAEGVAGCR